MCSVANQIFGDAVDRELIPGNPFKHRSVPTTSVASPDERCVYVPCTVIEEVMEDGCPDTEWRLLLALVRYAGLRNPSETLRLRWQDIDWAKERMTVWSPKTEHHPNGKSRLVPIFPILRPHLDAAFSQAADGAEHVIARYRDSATNLRTQLGKIASRAGYPLWPKPFHNMRASCATDLVDHHAEHVVCRWMRHSKVIARKHYLHVVDKHFEKARQNARQYGAESECTGLHANREDKRKPPEYGGVLLGAVSCEGEKWTILDSNQ